MRTLTLVTALLAACAARPAAVTPPEAALTSPAVPQRATIETVLVLTSTAAPKFSADGAHALAVVTGEGGKQLWLDGREIARGTQGFQHTAIGADGSWATFLSGEPLSYEEEQKTGKPARNVLVHRGVATEIAGAPSGLAVTGDGAHVLYAADLWLKDDGVVVRDGVTIGGGFAMRMLTLSPDGTRWAMATSLDRKGSGERVTVDGVVGPRYPSVWGLTFSADSRHVAYKAYQPGEESSVLVVDGRPSKRYQRVDENVRFTADGRVVAEVFRDGAAWVRVGDTEHPGGTPCEVQVAGNAVAWIGEVDEPDRHLSRAFLDGVEVFRREEAAHGGGDYAASLGSLALAPNGARLAFATFDGVQVIDRGGAARVLGGGAPLAFDPTGDQLAVWVREPDARGFDVWQLGTPGGVVNGPRFGRAATVYEETIRFSEGEVRFFARDDDRLLRVRLPLTAAARGG